MTNHYINRYLLRTLGILCLMLSLGIGQRGYAQSTEQEQLAKLRTFKKEFIALALSPRLWGSDVETELRDKAMEAFFSAVSNPEPSEYEAAYATCITSGWQYRADEVPDKQLYLDTFKKALRNPSAYPSDKYDAMTQESEYRAVKLAWFFLGEDVLGYRTIRDAHDVSSCYGIAKWGINVSKTLSRFEQMYAQPISEESVMIAHFYMHGVWAHDLMQYLQSKGIAITLQELREVYAKVSSMSNDDEAMTAYFNNIKPNINKEEAFYLVLKPEGFVQHIEQSYRRNVAIPLGIKLP